MTRKVYIGKWMIGSFMVLGVAASALAVERLTLTTPVTREDTEEWELEVLTINRTGHPTVTSIFREPTTDEVKTCIASAGTATAFISLVNTADLTNNSLIKQATDLAVTEGCLGAGAVGGTPD